MPPVILITTIPISIAGWGLRESAMVAIFGFISIVQEDAIALSLLFGLPCACVVYPGLVIWTIIEVCTVDVDSEGRRFT